MSSSSFTLDRNEINKIAQAHRVAETGRPDGRPIPIGQIDQICDRSIWPKNSTESYGSLHATCKTHRFKLSTVQENIILMYTCCPNPSKTILPVKYERNSLTQELTMKTKQLNIFLFKHQITSLLKSRDNWSTWNRLLGKFLKYLVNHIFIFACIACW